MEKEFIPYELALRMKELSFDEPCLASYYTDIPENLLTKNSKNIDYRKQFNGLEYHPLDKNGVEWEPNFIRNTDKTHYVSAATFSQAFRWFREKYNWQASIIPTRDQHKFEVGYNYWIWNLKTGEEYHTEPKDRPCGDWVFQTHEDAETCCLEKLIELLEN